MANIVEIVLLGRDRSRGIFSKGSRGLDQMRASALRLRTALAGLGVGLAVRSLTRAAVEMEATRNSFKAITGSAEIAQGEINFLRQTADRLGLSFQETAASYRKLAAAANQSALQGQATKDIFLAIAEASTTLGLSAQDTEGSLFAVTQMISKGKVSAEELRRQLGERLPGAFNIMARALGVSTRELDRMLSAGEVMTEDALPAFAAELRKTFAPGLQDAMDSTRANLNRLATAWFEMKVAVGESGLITALTEATKWLTGFLKTGGELLEIMPDLNSEFKDMGDNTTKGSNAMRSMARFLVDLKAEFKATKEVIVFVGRAIGTNLAIPIEFTVKVVHALIGAFADMKRALIDVFEAIKRLGQPISLLLQGEFTAAWESAKGVVSDFGDVFDELGKNIVKRIKEMAGAGVSSVASAVSDIGHEWSNLKERITEAAFEWLKAKAAIEGTDGQGPQLPTIPNADPNAGAGNGAPGETQLNAWEQYKQSVIAAYGEMSVAARNFGVLTMRTVTDNISSGIANIVTGAQKAGEAFKQLGLTVVATLVKAAVQMAINSALASAFRAKSTTESVAAAAITASSWAPAAAAVNAATFGGGATSGSIALASIAALASSLFVGQAHAGMKDVPKDGTYLLNMQKGEQIIPRGGGGGGGNQYYTIELDGQPLLTFMREASEGGRLIIDPRAVRQR